MLGLIIWLLFVLLIAAAFLGVVRAILATPPFQSFAPYSNLIYTIIVLLVVLWIVQSFYSGVPLVGLKPFTGRGSL